MMETPTITMVAAQNAKSNEDGHAQAEDSESPQSVSELLLMDAAIMCLIPP